MKLKLHHWPLKGLTFHALINIKETSPYRKCIVSMTLHFLFNISHRTSIYILTFTNPTVRWPQVLYNSSSVAPPGGNTKHYISVGEFVSFIKVFTLWAVFWTCLCFLDFLANKYSCILSLMPYLTALSLSLLCFFVLDLCAIKTVELPGMYFNRR